MAPCAIFSEIILEWSGYTSSYLDARYIEVTPMRCMS